jgi:hypothetical protein
LVAEPAVRCVPQEHLTLELPRGSASGRPTAALGGRERQEGTHHRGVGGGEEGQVQPRAPPMPPATAHRQVHVGSGARGSDLMIGKLERHSYSLAQGPATAGGGRDPLTAGEEVEAEARDG